MSLGENQVGHVLASICLLQHQLLDQAEGDV